MTRDITSHPSGISMGIPTPPLSLFEGQTPSGRPIGKCHSDHSILKFDGLSISSSDSAQVAAWKHQFCESGALILSKFRLEPIEPQNGVVEVTFSDGSSARRNPLNLFSIYLGELTVLIEVFSDDNCLMSIKKILYLRCSFPKNQCRGIII